jgi:sugar lactone lactonase YvrE
LGALLASAQTQPVLRLTHWDRGGHLAWTNALVPGICTVEVADQLNGKWTPGGNYYSTNSGGQATVPANGACQFVRLQSVDVGPTAQGFTNFVYAYGILETIAGNGAGQTDGVSYWQSYFEGWPGSWAALSRPHFAMADRAGAVYIADKNSHSILRLTPEGLIYTHAGTHAGGYNGEGPAMATNLQLNLPNSLWVRADGVVYALDTGNGRVRRVETNGIMSTLFLCTSDGSALSGGRGLWVKDDEMLAYFCAETRVRKWTPAGGLSTLASGFSELGDLYVEASGDVLVCDRKGNAVYRVTPGGKKTIIAGNGTANGGGDGYPALATGLEGVRGVWPVPTGGLLLLTHDSSRLWYMDTAGTVRLLLEGGPGRTHSGDGMFFYGPEPKISEGRSVTVDYAGNLLVCESDYGFVRRIRFQRVAP